MGVRIDRAPIPVSGGPMTESTPAPSIASGDPLINYQLVSPRIPGWLIKVVMRFAAQERMRYQLNCLAIAKVHRTLIDDLPGMRLVATDGRAMCFVDLAFEKSKDHPLDFKPFPLAFLDRADIYALRGGDYLQLEDKEIRIIQKCGTKREPDFQHRYTLHTFHEGNFPNAVEIAEKAEKAPSIVSVFANPEFLERAAVANNQIMKRNSDNRGGGVDWRGGDKPVEPFTSVAKATISTDFKNEYLSYRLKAITCIMPVQKE
jgi:hypothetical protein